MKKKDHTAELHSRLRKAVKKHGMKAVADAAGWSLASMSAVIKRASDPRYSSGKRLESALLALGF